jgi:predicted regulator of amino acid metabolism with ACT domain
MIKFAKKIYINIDDKRENVEDFIADNILKRWDELKNVDDLRRAGTLAVINVISAYAQTYGLPALTEDVKEKIADANVKILKKLNNKLQKQLKKKSKAYEERNKDV